VARLASYWYVACLSKQLKNKPISRTVLGTPIVLCRLNGKAVAFLDRCPHRNVPLSVGDVVDGALQCGYHGWRFSGDGACVEVPGLCGNTEARGRRATAYPVVERDGFVWVYPTADVAPQVEPWSNPVASAAGYTTVCVEFTINGTLHAVLENILDVPHTAFLHGGLFRTSKDRKEIKAVVKRTAEAVEAQFIGEDRPSGLLGRILAPSGGEVEHFDRFLMPSLAQVEYRLGDRSHVLATQCLTPQSDFLTRCFVVISFRVPIPGWLIRPFVEPVLWRVLKQDADMLKLQSSTIQNFGGERYASTELDVLGPHIWQLLKNAERGGEPLEPMQRDVQMMV